MMPQNTRPRTVTNNTPDPSVIPIEGDAYKAVFDMLNQMQQQPTYQAPQQSILQTILNALAQGGAILASPDSGATLANFLNQRAQIQEQRAQAQAQQRNQINAAMIQSALEKARGITTEQQQSRQDLRRFELGKKEELFKEVQEIQRKQKLLDWEQANLPTIVDNLKAKSIAEKYPDMLNASLLREVNIRALTGASQPVAKEIADYLSGLKTQLSDEAKVYYDVYATKTGVEIAQKKVIEAETAQANINKLKADAKEAEARAGLYEAQANVATLTPVGGSKQTRDFITEGALKSLNKTIEDGPHYRMPNGSIVGQSDFVELRKNALTMNDAAKAQQLSPEEEAIFIKQQIGRYQQLQEELTKMPNDRQPGANPVTNLSPTEIQNNIESLRRIGKTDQQIRAFMEGKGFSQEDINKYLTPITSNQNKPNQVTIAPRQIETERRLDTRTGKFTDVQTQSARTRDDAARLISVLYYGSSSGDNITNAYQLYDIYKSQYGLKTPEEVLQKATEIFNQRRK